MITLHQCPQTRSMRTLWLLHELRVPFQVETYPFDKTLRQPEFLARSPAGRVPALDIDGRTVFETGAITELLCERFSQDGLGRRPGHVERADWLIWIHFAETISQHVAALTQQHIMLYEDHMRSPLVMRLEAARLGKCFDAVEARLRGREMLLDGGFSAADISVGQAIYMGQHFHKLDSHRHVAAWMSRLAARTGFRSSLPKPDQRLYEEDFYEAWDG